VRGRLAPTCSQPHCSVPRVVGVHNPSDQRAVAHLHTKCRSRSVRAQASTPCLALDVRRHGQAPILAPTKCCHVCTPSSETTRFAIAIWKGQLQARLDHHSDTGVNFFTRVPISTSLLERHEPSRRLATTVYHSLPAKHPALLNTLLSLVHPTDLGLSVYERHRNAHMLTLVQRLFLLKLFWQCGRWPYAALKLEFSA
jgi:hypothetical protein